MGGGIKEAGSSFLQARRDIAITANDNKILLSVDILMMC
jgi:hypothetical protein